MIRVLIADDHTLIREGLKNTLRDEPDITVSGEAHTAAEVLDRMSNAEYDVLVLDLGLPDRPGLDVLREAKRIQPRLCVLILTMYPEDRFALRSIKAGADGYLSKESAAGELVTAIRQIHRGHKYVSQKLSDGLLQMVRGEVPLLEHERLTDREFQILQLIASGSTLSGIAAQLHLSVSTVNTHRTHILEKLHLQSNAELIRYAIENKLI